MPPQNSKMDYAALARQYGGVSGPVEDLMSMIRGHDAAHEVQTHKIISPETGLTTEESEHARQLKQARPLSTAIPQLPTWANTPILPTVEKYGEKIDRALGQGPEIDARKKALAAYDVQHPIQAGISQAINQTAEGMTTPANLALMATIPESKIMSAFFALQAAQGAYKDAGAAKDAFLAGKNEDAARLATQAILSGGMAGLAGTHAISGTPLGDVIAEDARTLAKGGSPAEAGFVELPFGDNNSGVLKTSEIISSPMFQFRPEANPKTGIVEPLEGEFDPSKAGRIVVWKNPKDGKMYVVQGFHRLDLAKRSGIPTVAVEHLPAKDVPDLLGRLKIREMEKEKSKTPKEPVSLIPTGAYKAFDESSPFYLKSEQIVPEKMKGPMPAQDVHKMLLSNGVKPEELKWIGLDKYLGDKGKEKVSPSEIIQHIRDNALQIQEVPHGEGPEVQQAHEQWFALGEQGNKLVSEGKYDEAMKVFDQEREARLKYESLRNKSIPTKHGGWTMPGGENYRELLVTMLPRNTFEELDPEIRRLSQWPRDVKTAKNPEDQQKLNELNKEWERRYSQSAQFKHPHWDNVLNVLAHVRFNDRTGPNGERLLHIEELQSDLHQQARTQGYRLPSEETAPMDSEYRALVHKNADARARGEEPNPKDVERAKALEDALIKADKSNIPDAPFKKTDQWVSLLLKRMLRYASDNGYDGISFTPSAEQADRYNLSKHLDRIEYEPIYDEETGKPNGKYDFYAIDKNGNRVLEEDEIGLDRIEQIAGKEIAEKIRDDKGSKEESENKSAYRDWRALTGLDLKVGGEWTNKFYGEIVPNAANKILKPFGAKVEETKVEVPASWKEQKHVYKGPEPTEEDIDKLYNAAKSNGPDIFINPITGQKEQFAINRVSVSRPLREIRDLVSRGADIKEVLATHGNNEIAQLLGGDLEQVVKPKMKEVPYIQITPKMRDVLKKVPFSLFTILATALGLGSSGPQAKAEDKNNPAPKENFSDILAQAKLRHPSNPHRVATPDGGIYAFPDAESLANFKQELGLE